MALELRYNTADQELPLGYFLDSTDGDTEETALTIANTDIKIWKWGATTLANKNSGGGTHISNGVFYAVFDATDTNTLGPAKIFVHVSGALAFEVEVNVVSQQYWDSKYGSGNFSVDVIAISGDSTAADNLESACDGGSYNVGGGAVVAASVTAGVTLADDAIALSKFDETTAWPLVAADSGATQVARVGADGDTLETLSDQLDVVTADTNELQTDLTDGGRLDLLIDAILADTAELQTDDTPGALAAIDAKIDVIDGIVDDILEDTGTTLQGELDGIQSDTEDLQTQIGTAGDGLTGVPWNAAWDAEVQSEVFDALDAAFDDSTGLTANGALDRLRTIGWIIRNKLAITNSNGNLILYKDDSTTPAFSVSGALTDDSTTTVRLRLA